MPKRLGTADLKDIVHETVEQMYKYRIIYFKFLQPILISFSFTTKIINIFKII